MSEPSLLGHSLFGQHGVKRFNISITALLRRHCHQLNLRVYVPLQELYSVVCLQTVCSPGRSPAAPMGAPASAGQQRSWLGCKVGGFSRRDGRGELFLSGI